MTQPSPATYLPPAKYIRSDGVQCCPHATPVGPGSCPHCWELHQSSATQPSQNPTVQGHCPACRRTSLFLGNGGHVTCARLDCPSPCAADDLLHGQPAAEIHTSH